MKEVQADREGGRVEEIRKGKYTDRQTDRQTEI